MIISLPFYIIVDGCIDQFIWIFELPLNLLDRVVCTVFLTIVHRPSQLQQQSLLRKWHFLFLVLVAVILEWRAAWNTTSWNIIIIIRRCLNIRNVSCDNHTKQPHLRTLLCSITVLSCLVLGTMKMTDWQSQLQSGKLGSEDGSQILNLSASSSNSACTNIWRHTKAK